MKGRNRKIYKSLWVLTGLLFVLALIFGVLIYSRIFSPNVHTGVKDSEYILIPTGSDLDDVIKILHSRNLLKDEESFLFTSRQMKYEGNIRPGRYKVKDGMTNKELVTLLRSGRQTPVNVIFNNIRTKEQLASRISEQIEAGSSALVNLMNDADYLYQIGFNPQNVLSLFIPDTYEMYWNTSADQFIRKMHTEYKKFWNKNRMIKADSINLTPIEVSILASIVQQETNRNDEKPDIAGVYMNRLRKDWRLEADPTLVYALGDFSIQRVLHVHKSIESPYNTYKYKGLPPGPICLPTSVSIDAVLNYNKHPYFYFCAREDFSGYHNFAKNYVQHLINARKFQRALNQRGIKS